MTKRDARSSGYDFTALNNVIASLDARDELIASPAGSTDTGELVAGLSAQHDSILGVVGSADMSGLAAGLSAQYDSALGVVGSTDVSALVSTLSKSTALSDLVSNVARQLASDEASVEESITAASDTPVHADKSKLEVDERVGTLALIVVLWWLLSAVHHLDDPVAKAVLCYELARLILSVKKQK